MNDRLVLWTKCLAIFTGLLFAITVVLAVLSYKQTLDSNRALATSQRAFVYAEAAGNLFGVLPDKSIVLRQLMRFTNSGNTQTSHLIFLVRCITNPRETEEPFVLFYKGDVKSTPSLIGPKAVTFVACDFPIHDIEEMQQQKAYGYLIGQMFYNDIIDTTKRHRTDFCYKYIDVHIDLGSGPPQSLAPSSSSSPGGSTPPTTTGQSTTSAKIQPTFFANLQPAGSHNCADDECPADTVLK